MFPRIFKVVALILVLVILPSVSMAAGKGVASDDGSDGDEITEFA